MEYTKTVWKDLPDTSTPITADRLNNIEDGVEYLFELGVDVYSTNETKTNKVWIDGKPIYRKIIEINKNNLVSGDNYITYDFSTTGTVTNLELMYERQYHLINKAPANTTASNIDDWYVQLTADKDNNRFIITLGSVLVSRINNGYSIWILLEYTKTTD